MGSKIDYALELLEGAPLEYLKSLSKDRLFEIDEIRLRANRPMTLSIGGKDIIADGVAVTPEMIDRVFKNAFNYSLHSYPRELSSGYVTARGGNRVGICGTAVISQESASVSAVKKISSVNIRIAREIKGCAAEVAERCFFGGLCGILVTGPPSSGKTTLLRDLCRIIGNRFRTSLIDEQNEIAAVWQCVPQNDVGVLTDVFTGYPKPAGVEAAIRTMSPRAVIVDEIGTPGDVEALGYALHSGAALITAVHAVSFEEALKKPAVIKLMKENAFGYAAELTRQRSVRVVKID